MVIKMSEQKMPWSFYTTLISFAIFFASLCIYVMTSILHHPYASDLWLIGVIGGFILLLYSVRMVRVHQREMIEAKEKISEETDS